MFDDYLGTLQPDQGDALRAIVAQVAKTAPDATEGRSYGLSAFRYRDKPLLGFAAAKNHLSLYPFSPAVLEEVKDSLAGFDVSKGTVRFTADRPVPAEVVEKIVRARIAEIER